MPRGSMTIAVSLFGLLLAPEHLAGQMIAPPGLGVGVNGALISVSPERDQRELGSALEASFRYTLRSGVQLVAGASYGLINVDQTSANRTFINVYANPRFVLFPEAENNWTPFIGLFAGYIRHDLDLTPSLEIQGDGGECRGHNRRARPDQ